MVLHLKFETAHSGAPVFRRIKIKERIAARILEAATRFGLAGKPAIAGAAGTLGDDSGGMLHPLQS